MKTRLILLFFVMLLVLGSFSSAQDPCTDSPIKLDVVAQNLYEGTPYELNMATDNAEQYDFVVIGASFPNFNLDSETGIISFTPTQEDVDFHKVLLIASNQHYCYDSKIVEFMVYDRPDIILKSPAEPFVEVYEGNSKSFSIEVRDNDEDESFSYRWLLDGNIISSESGITHYFDFNSSGSHELTIRITDKQNLTAARTWNLSVVNVNRAPELIGNITDQSFYVNHNSSPFNLNSFFKDSDGDKLSFSYLELPAYPIQNKMEIKIQENGRVSFFPRKDFIGRIRVKFKARDPEGLEAVSNIIYVQTIEFSVKCGDGVCFQETCETCPEDCGVCGKCEEKWGCGDWSDCKQGETQTRECVDKNLCGTKLKKPETSRPCPYSCTDGLKNQGEEGIDCGGPCGPCTTCNNRKLDGDETDIDCGGSCRGCTAGMKCLKGLDCASFVCTNNICQKASCSDNTRNQGEEGIDCGGPCPKECASCNDGKKNGDEEGVDCGGQCPPCPTCNDGIKNGDEKFVDCGGSCRKCGIRDYLEHDRDTILRYLIPAIVAFVVFVGVILGFKHLFGSVKIHTNVGILIFLNSFARILRRKTQFRNQDILKETIRRFDAIDKNPKDTEDAAREVVDIITKMYSQLFELPKEFKTERLYFEIKNSKLPRLTKSILMSFYAQLEEMKKQDYIYAVQIEKFARQGREIADMLKKDMKA